MKEWQKDLVNLWFLKKSSEYVFVFVCLFVLLYQIGREFELRVFCL